jgi:hypothetical protein
MRELWWAGTIGGDEENRERKRARQRERLTMRQDIGDICIRKGAPAAPPAPIVAPPWEGEEGAGHLLSVASRSGRRVSNNRWRYNRKKAKLNKKKQCWYIISWYCPLSAYMRKLHSQKQIRDILYICKKKGWNSLHLCLQFLHPHQPNNDIRWECGYNPNLTKNT